MAGTIPIPTLFRLRFVLLAAALALSLAAAKFAFDSPDALRVLTPFLRGAGIFFCAAYCLLLFWRLALYAALVAFLAPLWTIGFFSLLHAPFPSAAPITLLLMGAITATVCLQHFAVGAGALSRWADPETAANLAQRPGLYCGALAHLPAAVGAVALSGLSVNNIAANGEFAFIAWSAFLLVAALVIPAIMFTYTPSENFAAHVNHARERGEIFLFHVALVAMPRWAYATIGIAFVLATIFFFRGEIGRAHV